MRVLWFVLLLPFVAMAAQKQNSCIGKNSFLESMSKAKPLSVEIYDSLQESKSGKCGLEWSLNGICCDVDDLTLFITVEGSFIDQNRDAVVQTLKDHVRFVTDALDRMASTKKDLAASTVSDAIRKASGRFEKDASVCWDYMKKVRGSALCSICSGRSDNYFKGDKILISPETCSKGVSNCEGFFSSLSELQVLVPKAAEVLKKYETHVEVGKSLSNLKKDLDTYSPPKELTEAFSKYDTLKANQNQIGINQQSAKICEMIMNIRKTPYIMVMNPSNIRTVEQAILQQIRTKFDSRIEKLRKDVNSELKEVTTAEDAKQKALATAFKASIVEENKRFEAAKAQLRTRKAKEQMADTLFNELLAKEQELHRVNDVRLTAEFTEKSKRNEQEKVRTLADINARYHSLIQNLTQKSMQLINDNKAEVRKQDSNWKAAGRSLNSLSRLLFAGSNNVFESDSLVFLKPTDSMFTSFVGATGSLDQFGTHSRAMNMSLAFP